MAKIKLNNFGPYNDIIDRLIADIANTELCRGIIAVERIKEAVLSAGATEHFSSIRRETDIIREQNRATRKEDLTLTEEQHNNIFKKGLFDMQPVLERELNLPNKSLEVPFANFKQEVNVLFTQIGKYFYENDNACAREKYRVLKELGEVYPFCDKDMNKDNLLKALQAACIKSREVTIIHRDQLLQQQQIPIADILIGKYNFNIEVFKMMKPDVEIPPLIPVSTSNARSFTENYLKSQAEQASKSSVLSK